MKLHFNVPVCYGKQNQSGIRPVCYENDFMHVEGDRFGFYLSVHLL